MCQARVYLKRNGQEEEILRDVIQLEITPEGLRLATFFEEPKLLQARLTRVDFLKHIIFLEEEKR